MMDPQLEWMKSGLSLGVSLITLGLGCLFVRRMVHDWTSRQKQREADLATAQSFHNLYGEFFAVWKRWNHSFETGESDIVRADLFVQACTAEGALEALFVRLAAMRELNQNEIRTLGRFRQSYQMLRETIGNGERLGWSYSEHPEYLAFKRRATAVALIITSDSSPEPGLVERRTKALIAITSNGYESPGDAAVAHRGVMQDT